MKRTGAVVRRLGLSLAWGALGVVVGGAAVLIYVTRSGPTLELWHRVELDAEFTAARADEIDTFSDYQLLEDQLFAQLDAEVYAQTGTGVPFTLARYSAGSAADPRQRRPNWNRSFELPSDPASGGILLLHGMSDSPYSLRALGEAFNQHGHWVVGLRLPGHGTAPSGLTTVRWEDMAAAVRLGVDHLASKVGPAPIHIVGYSTGAPLALDYVLEIGDDSPRPRPASLVLISPSIAITPVAALAKWQRRLAFVPGLERLAWTTVLPEFDPYKYNSFATNAADQVHRLTRSVAARIETRAGASLIEGFPPTLVFLSTVDATVSADAVIDNLLEHLAPHRHELVLFDVNRFSVNRTVLVSDPGPLTARLMANDALPFAVTVLTNESDESAGVVSRHKASLSDQVTIRSLPFTWPTGVISLSHVALPFPPDDPLYGQRRPESDESLQLGQIAVQGELGMLQVPSDWLLRLRHNPFYDFLADRALDWVANVAPSNN